MPGSAGRTRADRLLERLADALDRSLGAVLAALMFAMMLLTFLDVVGRQGFDSPISGSNELTEIAMGFVVYVGLPLVCIRREHITIGLLGNLLGGKTRRVQNVVLNLVLAAAAFVWARQVWIQAGVLLDTNAVLMFLQVSVAPCVFVMSGLTFRSSLLFGVLAACHLLGADPKPAAETG